MSNPREVAALVDLAEGRRSAAGGDNGRASEWTPPGRIAGAVGAASPFARSPIHRSTANSSRQTDRRNETRLQPSSTPLRQRIITRAPLSSAWGRARAVPGGSAVSVTLDWSTRPQPKPGKVSGSVVDPAPATTRLHVPGDASRSEQLAEMLARPPGAPRRTAAASNGSARRATSSADAVGGGGGWRAGQSPPQTPATGARRCDREPNIADMPKQTNRWKPAQSRQPTP